MFLFMEHEVYSLLFQEVTISPFKKSKKRRYCRIVTPVQSYAFSTKQGEEKLVVEKIEGVR